MASTHARALFMLDTNAISDAVRNPAGGVATRLGDLLPGQAVISVIVEGELRYSIAKGAAHEIEHRVDALLTMMDVVGLDSAVARRYGIVRAHLAAKGTPIGMNDLWIGVHALELGLTLVTDNGREFTRVPGLVVQNWQRATT
ncbi:MAG: PIN domain-containing protein [Propionibacteriaceae bacterium]|nr:PIN domain-containing protein [Propionibacteriaceae bacterium]